MPAGYLAGRISNLLSGRIPDIEKGQISGTFLLSEDSRAHTVVDVIKFCLHYVYYLNTFGFMKT